MSNNNSKSRIFIETLRKTTRKKNNNKESSEEPVCSILESVFPSQEIQEEVIKILRELDDREK